MKEEKSHSKAKERLGVTLLELFYNSIYFFTHFMALTHFL